MRDDEAQRILEVRSPTVHALMMHVHEFDEVPL